MHEAFDITVTIPVAEKHRRQLRNACQNGNFNYTTYEAVNCEDVRNAHMIIGNIPPELLSHTTKLKLLHLNFAGTDGYPQAMPKGAVLTNSSGAYGLAISEHMLAMLLSITKKLYLYRDNQNGRLWCDEGNVTSIEDSVILTVGVGDIGGEFAKKCKALGAYNIGIRRTKLPPPDYIDEMYTLDALDGLLQRADVVALALPSGNDTDYLFNKSRIAMMKRGALLINVGRGRAVDSYALAEACNAGHIRAALDVTDPEPLPTAHPLWSAKGCIITPHISGFFHLPQTLDRIVNIGAENLRRVIAGEPLLNVVDSATGYRVYSNRA